MWPMRTVGIPKTSISTKALTAAGLLVVAWALFGCTDSADTSSSQVPADSEGADSEGADSESGDPQVAIVNLNVLHGNQIAVPECDNVAELADNCAAPDRIQILSDLVNSDCPDIVTLQEVDIRIEELLNEALPQMCDGAYSLHLLAEQSVSLGIDREAILTTLPVTDETLLDLPAIPWSAHHVVLESDLGQIDLITTHLASGSNNPLCSESDCPAVCSPTDDVRVCGAKQILEHLESSGGENLWVVTGDLNAQPGEPAHEVFVNSGFADSMLSAGNDECSPSVPEGCTGGRSELDLTDPSKTTTNRIDYILVKDSEACAVRHDESSAAGWANEPAEPVGTSGVVWASDHSGVRATLRCE